VTEAKANVPDLVDAAMKGALQIITRRGVEAVVILSMKTCRSVVTGPKGTLLEFSALPRIRWLGSCQALLSGT
jgi:prevent-host-death family protein